MDDATSTQAAVVTGLSHLAINTADLNRFRRFYEDILGLPLGLIMRMDHPPYLRHATFHLSDAAVLHVFEVPGYDPQAQGIGTTIGERGRIDHFALMVRDETALREMAERLVAAGATSGRVQRLGWLLSVHVTDPDGLQLEINCLDPDYDIDSDPCLEEVGRTDWLARLRTAVTTDSSLLSADQTDW